jgi:hypothetical protein
MHSFPIMSVSGSVLRQGTHADPTEGSVVPQNAFGLQNDVPEAALDSEWCALVRQHAQTLAGMLQRIQLTAAGGQQRADACRDTVASLESLAASAARSRCPLAPPWRRFRLCASLSLWAPPPIHHWAPEPMCVVLWGCIFP